MRRSALFLLTLQLAAGPVLAQTMPSLPPAQPAAPGNLPVRTSDRMTTFPANLPAPAATQPTAPVYEALANFDPQHTEVQWAQNHWQLVADGQLLKDFGRREIDARVAQRVVRDLHLTQHGVIGSPQPVMEYWLTNGRAPSGLTTGMHVIPVDAQQVRVEQIHSQWCLRDSSRVLFSFGASQTDAQSALAILHKYNFTQIGVLGDAGPSMLVLLGHPESDTGDPNMPHLTRQSPLHAATPSDPHATNVQQAKFAPTDNSPYVAPVVPPLRAAMDTHKDAVNAFGKTETVEVLPLNDPTKLRHTPPAPMVNELIDRTTFDWRQVQLHQESAGQYVLTAGSLVLGRFSNDHDGRLAQSAIQHYRFTELNHVGRPQPFASFFTAGNEAPVGQFYAGTTERFQPDKLTLKQIDNRWAIVAPDKPLLWFGAHQEEARVTLDVIQHNHFDRLCRIGDERGLTFFVRSH